MMLTTGRGLRAGAVALLLVVGPGRSAEPARARQVQPARQAAETGQAHDKAWWQAVKAGQYALPPGGSLRNLLRELSAYLGSTDPELRDDIAYTVLTQWLYVKRLAPPEVTRQLVDEWIGNLEIGIGEDGTDSVFRRSFSALMLSVAAALDNEAPYLERAGFRTLLDAALRYLRAEDDTRGFDPAKGWMHSVAHTADLLKFLGRSRHLAPAGQADILTGIAGKVGGLGHVLVHGEDERLARAVVSIVAREDADLVAFEAFLSALRPVPGEGQPTPALLAANQNRRHLAAALYVVLSTDPRDLETLTRARAMTLDMLRG
jgi:hypothetical protein